jgi:hypothetical protein
MVGCLQGKTLTELRKSLNKRLKGENYSLPMETIGVASEPATLAQKVSAISYL